MEDESAEGFETCPHCGEPMMWEDMFGSLWCEEMYWGPKSDGS